MTFSIIIPVYNVAPYLRECLDSVLAQTYTDWEAICVDDGSTDGSGAILGEYATKDKRFRVMHQANAGVSAARNAGIDVATGDWLWFVDGDDGLAPNALIRVAEEIERNPDIDVLRCGFFRFSEDDWQEDSCSYGLVNLSNEIPEDEMGGCTLITWRNILRRSRCADIRFAPYVCGEDRLYTFECLQRTNLLVRIPDRLYGYRCRPQSYTTDVIKTYRGWEGELAYRMEFLEKSVKSRKHIHFEGASWLLPYLASEHFIGFMVSDLLTEAEKRRLFKQWRGALPDLRNAPPFSPLQRLGLILQTVLCFYPVAKKYVHLHLWIFGQDQFLRKLYRRIRRHGEFANGRVGGLEV